MTDNPATIPQDPKLLERIVKLAKKQIHLEKRLEQIKLIQKRKQAQFFEVAGGPYHEGLLPLALQEAHVDHIGVDGYSITVEPQLKVPSLAKDAENREDVLNWIEEIGEGKVIKDTIFIPFEKQSEIHAELIKFLDEKKLLWTQFRTMHPATFKKFIKDLLESPPLNPTTNKPIDVPMERLGIEQFNQSQIE